MAVSDQGNAGQRAPRRARWKRILAFSLGAVAALFVLTLIVGIAFAERWTNTYVQRYAIELSRTLGRPVRVGHIDVALLSGRVAIDGFTLGIAEGEPANARPFDVAHASIDVGMLQTLFSLGMRPRIESIIVDDPRITVLKRQDGALNWQQISTRMTQQPAAEEEQTSARNDDWRLDLLRMTRGLIRFIDMADPSRAAAISAIDLKAHAGKRTGLGLTLQAAVLAPQRNLNVEASVGRFDQARALPRIERLRVELSPVELAPLSPFFVALGPSARGLNHGILSASLHAQEKDDGKLTAQGDLSLARALFSGGQEFDAQVALNVSSDPSTGRIEIGNLMLEADAMRLIARGAIRQEQDVPRAESLDVRSEALSFDHIRSLYPAFDQLTEPARLRGGFAVRAQGRGDARRQQVDFELSLTHAAVLVRDVFDKPAGVPLLVSAKLDANENTLSFAPASVTIADWQLLARGRIDNLQGETPRVDLKLSTPNPAANGLLRLLPPIASRVPANEVLAGSLAIQGNMRGSADRFNADGSLRLADFSVDVPDASIRGGGTATFSLRAEGPREQGKLDANFTTMQARYADVLQKPAGMPLRAQMNWTRNNARTVTDLNATVASLVTRVKATLEGEAPRQTFSADVSIPKFAVRPLLSMLASPDALKIGDIRFAGNAHARGVTGRPEALQVNVPNFTAQSGRSDLRGSLRLANADKPNIEVKGRSNYFDIEDFLPAGMGEEEEPEQEEEESGLLANTRGNIDIAVARGRVAGVDIEDMRAQLTLNRGRAKAQELELKAFGGRFSGKGSDVPLLAGQGPYRLRGGVSQMRVEGVLARFAAVNDLLKGALSASMDLSASDLTPQALSNTLTGKLEGSIEEGTFLRGNATAALADRIKSLAKIPPLEQALSKVQARISQEEGWKLRDLAGGLRFEKGGVLLSSPLKAKTLQGDITLRGRLSLNGRNDLDGTFALTPGAVAELSGGELKPDKPLPVPFRIEGPLTRPNFAFGDLQPLMRPLLASYVREEGEKQVRRGAEEVLERAGLKKEAKEATRPGARRRREQEAKKKIKKRLRDVF